MRQRRFFGEPKISFSALARIKECTTLENLTLQIDNALRGLEVEYWVYTMQLDVSPTRREWFVIDRFPQGTRQKLLASCGMNDPTFDYARHYSVAILWDVLAANKFIGVDSKKVARFLKEAHASGIEKCLSVPVHGLGPVCAMLTLASRNSKHGLGEWQVDAEATLLAMYVHQTASTLIEKPITYPALTTRELECLRWAAEGKGAWDIASLLGITERTVFFHLTNACTKLGVATRQQAVAQALVMGLLTAEDKSRSLQLISSDKIATADKQDYGLPQEKKPPLKKRVKK